ncbi:peroxiredoxin [Palleronia aestuarii]|uniref:Peroxiredoxin n=1 Tax=Palleronia aestuarii TaxID=568105 RepID=A0A2W7N7N9_9RHOB|nr:peroxiredoxin-like family protein [Palleronia aestuarii]PZX15733.1 peroxiredoxin [Palleronia aestuarii]
MPTTPMPDETAPDLKVPLIIGTDWELSTQSPDAFTMIVVYRGLHCPICKSYLQELKSHFDDFVAKGFSVITISMDGKEKAQKAYDDWGLDNIPMGFDLSEEQAKAWGLYLSSSIQESETDTFAEPAVFWVRPDGRLYLSNIANMPFARPDLGLLLKSADTVAEKDYPARGTKAA